MNGPDKLPPLQTLRLDHAIPGGARFLTQAGPLEIIAYASGLIRFRLGEDTRPDYGLLVAPAEPIAARLETTASGYALQWDTLRLELDSQPLRLRLMQGARCLLESSSDGHIAGGWRIPPLAAAAGGWQMALGLPGGSAIFGLGEKYGPLNRRGALITNWNEDALGVNSELSYKNCPLAWSPEGWGLFVHTTGRVQWGVGYAPWSHRSLILRVEDEVLDVFFLVGATPAALLERYTWLTGRAPAIPRWSLGVWLSRCYYRTPEEVLEAAHGMRAGGFPCDVITLDGRAWLEVRTRFDFRWDTTRYPDLAGFVARLKALGYRVCAWEYPYVSIYSPLSRELAEKGYLLKNRAGETCLLEWDPEPFGALLTPLPTSGMVDFTHPEAYAWYRDQHRALFEAGIDVMKTDFGEQVPRHAVAANGVSGEQLHNVYPLLYNRCVYEATARYHPGEPLVWGRSGWTGSQRYPVQWGGDAQGDWEGLAASIRGGLSWGMSGVPFYTHDIGGFYGAPTPTHYVRSLQVGVLSSHTRLHGTSPREPWAFGEDAARVARAWLRFRYRLLPYLEACAREASMTGLPVARAMPLAFPQDRRAWTFETQYLLGPALLVTPVLNATGEVEVYLPDGAWQDLWDGRIYTGPQVLARRVPLEQVPLFGRVGATLPLGPVVACSDALPTPTPITESIQFGAGAGDFYSHLLTGGLE